MLIAFLPFFTLVVSYAMLRGGGPERTCALVFVAMAALQYSGRLFFVRVFDSVDLLSLAVDVFALLAFTFIALEANRKWPLCVAAMQLLSCASHLGREISDKVEPLVYASLKAGPTLVALTLLLIGTVLYHRKAKRGENPVGWMPGHQVPAWVPAFLMP